MRADISKRLITWWYFCLVPTAGSRFRSWPAWWTSPAWWARSPTPSRGWFVITSAPTPSRTCFSVVVIAPSPGRWWWSPTPSRTCFSVSPAPGGGWGSPSPSGWWLSGVMAPWSRWCSCQSQTDSDDYSYDLHGGYNQSISNLISQHWR